MIKPMKGFSVLHEVNNFLILDFSHNVLRFILKTDNPIQLFSNLL